MAAKLSKTARQTVSIIAHALVAENISKNVKGMDGFEEFWLKQEPAHTRTLVDLLRSESRRIYQELAERLKEDGYGTPS